MIYCILQISCLMFFIYVMMNSYIQGKHLKLKGKPRFFYWILGCAIIELVFDGLTAYTVNNLDTVPAWLNRWGHFGFLASIDAIVFLVLCYLLKIVDFFPKSKKYIVLLFCPMVINFIVLLTNIHDLRYIPGRFSWHCDGSSANACYIMATIYAILALAVFIKKRSNIEKRKQASIIFFAITLLTGVIIKFIYPDLLITSTVATILVLGIYLNNENPVIRDLSHYQDEMVMGFATLVENRDDNTGGHIKRTSLYVKRIAKEMQRKKIYSDIITKDFINNLKMAAPMHDIGKIAIPDAILQKPGKLSAEEYEVMKTHSTKGGEIIKSTFANVSSDEYTQMCLDVAVHHHEKWNGSGYPSGLKGEQIPLAARIMAVADVFDAISEERCYRPALTLEESFQIIEDGIGKDFDPNIAKIFMSIKNDIVRIHNKIIDEQKAMG